MVFLLYFFSGFSALLYQVAWQRFIALYAGSDGEAVALVVAAFLLGLGLGNTISGRIAGGMTPARALSWFASCELGVCIVAAISPALYYHGFYMDAPDWLRPRVANLTATFLSLLAPTTLMGMCFPLLAHATAGPMNRAATRISRLNAINILGAATGCLLSGWVFLGTLGYDWTVYLGCGVSALVALNAWLVSRKLARLQDQPDPRAEASEPGNPATQRKVLWRWCLLMLLSGFVAISLELVWFRVLSFMLGTLPYVFSLMLALILAGYSLGGFIMSRFLHRVQDPMGAFLKLQAWVLVVSAATLLLVTLGRPLFPEIHVYLHSPGARILGGVTGYAVRLALALLVLLPPNLLIGAGFPLSQAALLRDRHSVGRCVAWIQGANILGNLAACLLTGFGLFAWVGTEGTLSLLCLVGIGFAVAALWKLPIKRWLTQPVNAVMLALVVCAIGIPDRVTWWRAMHLLENDDDFVVAEDPSGVAAMGRRSTETSFTMYANGQIQGHTPLPEETHFPTVLVHEAPQKVLCIGIGAGSAVFCTGAHPAATDIVVCEILRSVAPMMQRFDAAHANEPPIGLMLRDPRFRFAFQDGRLLLLDSADKYDFILGNPLLPYNSRSGLLYSQEFFGLLYAKLRPGGIASWHCATPRIVRTFTQIFPYAIMLEGGMMLGSNEPLEPRMASLAARLASMPEAAQNLDLCGYASTITIPPVEQSWHPSSEREAGDINTDLHPKDEYGMNNEGVLRRMADRWF